MLATIMDKNYDLPISSVIDAWTWNSQSTHRKQSNYDNEDEKDNAASSNIFHTKYDFKYHT